MAQVIPQWMKEKRGTKTIHYDDEPIKAGFIEKNLLSLSFFLKDVISRRRYALENGLLQGLVPRSKILGIMVLVVGAAFTRHIIELGGFILLSIIMALCSKIGISELLRRLCPALIFASIVFLPVFFDFFTPGREFLSFKILGYGVSVTEEGISSGMLLIFRVFAIASLVSLLFLTTRESDIFKGMAGLYIPSFFVAALFMTLRYVFLLLKIMEDANMSRKSRTIRPSLLKDGRRWSSSRAAFIMERALEFSKEVSMAMQARGFAGELRFTEDLAFGKRDYLWLGFVFFVFLMSVGI